MIEVFKTNIYNIEEAEKYWFLGVLLVKYNFFFIDFLKIKKNFLLFY